MKPHNDSIKNGITFVLAAFMLFLSFNLSQAQPVMLVKDIFSGSASSAPMFLTDVNGTLFFRLQTFTGGALWKSDGTVNGTVLVKQFPVSTISLTSMANVNGMLFFQVNDGINGDELWKSDGTTGGTVLVADINPGPSNSSPTWLTTVNGTLYFTADDGTNGVELWKSDGTTAGTVLVKDINPGPGSSTPGHLVDFNGTLYFNADDDTNGRELWKSDGSVAGTVLVKDIWPGSPDSSPNEPTVINNVFFFSAKDPNNGRELWKSDGTAAGTVLVKDINPGSSWSGPFLFTNVDGTLFFRADDGTSGEEVWKSDGTTAGTVLLKDIKPGSADSFPLQLTKVNSTLFFTADDGVNCFGVWKSDGTTSGTLLVKDIWPGPCNLSPIIPGEFTDVGGTLFFAGHAPATGNELWKSDGTTPGTVLVEDINPGSGPNQHSNPAELTDVNGMLLFSARDNVVGEELWAVQPPITTSLTPINPPIQIPPSGGSFNFDATLANISGRSETRNVWNLITAPNGKTFTTIGPATVTLPSGFSGMKTLSQQIPGGAPAGQYTYAFNIGAYPDTIESSDSFTFTKSVSPSALQKSEPVAIQDWTVLDAQTGQPVNFDDWNAFAIETTTQDESIPQEFVLQQNYPNPFNPRTTISFALPAASDVTLAIYNLRGQLVRNLHSGPMAAGHHRVVWDGTDARAMKVASGVYLYRLKARGAGGPFVAANKLVLMK